MKNLIFCFFCILLVSSCVTKKKYTTLKTSNNQTIDSLRVAYDVIQKDNFDLNQRNTTLQAEVVELRSDTTSKNRIIKNLGLRIAELEKINENLMTKQAKLIKQNDIESKKILEELNATRENLQEQEDELDSIRISLNKERSELNAMRKELDGKNSEIQSKNKRIAEMEVLIHRKDSILLALKNKVKNALVGYEGQGLSIIERDGKIYVLLDESLLFEVGKSTVSPKGVEALIKLAKVLELNPDINITIEGHTDNTGGAARNWELSTERALAISQILLQNSKIDGSRITVAGRGQYMPVDNANTPEARSKNRRTEIILTPDLSELYELINAQ